MSWKFAGIIFARNYASSVGDLLGRLGLSGMHPDGAMTFSRATSRSNQGAAVGIVNGHTLVLDHLLPYDCAYEPDAPDGPLDERLRSLSLGGDVLNFICDGMSGTYCYSLFRDGARLRRWAGEPGRVTCDDGAPLPAEPDPIEAAADSGEVRLFAVWEALLGLSFEDLVQDDRPFLTSYV